MRDRLRLERVAAFAADADAAHDARAFEHVQVPRDGLPGQVRTVANEYNGVTKMQRMVEHAAAA